MKYACTWLSHSLRLASLTLIYNLPALYNVQVFGKHFPLRLYSFGKHNTIEIYIYHERF